MAAAFVNEYIHRRVAESSAKGCDICYKLSSSVLITPDQKDFFYVCPVHLKDRYFCTPKVDEEAQRTKRERELAEETEKLKKEYEEKQRKKAEKKKADKETTDKGKDEKKETPKDEDENKADESEEAPKDEPDKALVEQEPRVFELKPVFYQQRLQRKRQNEAAKRDRERASQPLQFPSIPTHKPGK